MAHSSDVDKDASMLLADRAHSPNGIAKDTGLCEKGNREGSVLCDFTTMTAQLTEWASGDSSAETEPHSDPGPSSSAGARGHGRGRASREVRPGR